MRRLYHMTEDRPDLIPTLNFHADAVTVINPTRHTILIRVGGQDYPPSIEQADLVVPAVGAISYPTSGQTFALTFSEPTLETPPAGMPTAALVIFTFDEPVPNFGAMALATLRAEITNDTLNARITEAVNAFIEGGQVDTVIQNAVLPIQGDVNAVVTGAVDATIQNASIPVTGEVLATIQNAVLDVSGTVNIGNAVDARITNPSLTVTGAVDTLVQNTEAIPIAGNVDAVIQNASINTNVLNAIDANITNPSLTVTGEVDTVIQNAELQVAGTVNAWVQNASIPVTGDVNVTNASIPVTGSIDATIQNATINTEIVNTAVVSSEDTNPVHTGVSLRIFDTRYMGKDAGGTKTYSVPAGADGFAIFTDKYPISFDVEAWTPVDNLSTIAVHDIHFIERSRWEISQPLYVPIMPGISSMSIRVINRDEDSASHAFAMYWTTGLAPDYVANLSQEKVFRTAPIATTMIRRYWRLSSSLTGPTQRWEYTPPLGRFAVIESIGIFCDTTASANDATVYITIETSGGTVLSYVGEIWSRTDIRQNLNFAPGVMLESGEYLRAYNYNGGSARTFMATANIREVRQ